MYRVAAVVVVLVLCVAGAARAAEWPAVAPAHAALTKPRLDQSASAETLLWTVRITDSVELDHPQTILEHHLRIKIFDERGRDEHAKVDITYDDNPRVRDVEGRTIAPNGSITELRGQDVFDRTIVETNGIKLKAKSFALPAVVPGAIIDYRWREIRDNAVANYLELPFQRDIPTHHVRYELKALAVRELGYRMRVNTFNFQTPPDTGKADMGYTYFEMRDVAARRREAHMPPVLSVTPWMLIYYADLAEADRPPAQFWQRFGRSTFDASKPEIRVTNPIRTSAVEATRGATTVDDKVSALLRFVRAHVKRDDLGDTPSDRRANKDAAETLSKRIGDGHEVTVLFAALAIAAGLDVRLALLPDRTEYISHPDLKQPYFLDRLAVAVKSGERWTFVDPSNRYAAGARPLAIVEHPSLGRLLLFDPTDPHTPLGHLPLHEQGSLALIVHGEGGPLVRVPSAPSLNGSQREIEGRITTDGMLVARLRLARQGDPARRQRAMRAAMPDTDYQTLIEADVRRGFAGARITASDLAEDAAADTFDVSLDFAAPSFAQVLPGALLVVRPPQLAGGALPTLPAGPRATPIVLEARDELDRLRLDMPPALKVEELPKPQVVDSAFGQLRLEWTTQGGRVERTLQLRMPRTIVPPERHDELRAFLDAVRNADRATVVLTPGAF